MGVVGGCDQGCGWWVWSVLRLVGVVRGVAGECDQGCGWWVLLVGVIRGVAGGCCWWV